MALTIYDKELQPFNADPLRTFHNGYLGQAHEELWYLRNHDSSVYYTNIILTPEFIGGYNDAGGFGTTGWSVKLIYGKRRPTEMEWDLIRSGDALTIPDIGTTEAADTYTNHPIWIRVYCPGAEPAQLRENMQVKVSYFIRMVGA